MLSLILGHIQILQVLSASYSESSLIACRFASGYFFNFNFSKILLKQKYKYKGLKYVSVPSSSHRLCRCEEVEIKFHRAALGKNQKES